MFHKHQFILRWFSQNSLGKIKMEAKEMWNYFIFMLTYKMNERVHINIWDFGMQISGIINAKPALLHTAKLASKLTSLSDIICSLVPVVVHFLSTHWTNFYLLGPLVHEEEYANYYYLLCTNQRIYGLAAYIFLFRNYALYSNHPLHLHLFGYCCLFWNMNIHCVLWHLLYLTLIMKTALWNI